MQATDKDDSDDGIRRDPKAAVVEAINNDERPLLIMSQQQQQSTIIPPSSGITASSVDDDDMHFLADDVVVGGGGGISGDNSSGDIVVNQQQQQRKHSDSILSETSDDDDDDDFHKIPLGGTATRRNTIQYMEDASMEASLLLFNPDDDADNNSALKNADSKDSSSASSFTKIEAAGRWGRRRASAAESILVPPAGGITASNESGGDFDLLLSSTMTNNDGGSQQSSRSNNGGSGSSSRLMDEQSERGIFQAVVNHDLAAVTTNYLSEHEEEEPASPLLPSATSLATNGAAPGIKSVTKLSGASMTSALQILQCSRILPESISENNKNSDNNDGYDEDTMALHALFDGFCIPAVDVETCQAALELERRTQDATSKKKGGVVPLPEQPTIRMTPSSSSAKSQTSRIVALLQQRSGGSNSSSSKQTASTTTSNIFLQLPVHFSSALLRILIRLLSHETDSEYNEACFLTLPWKQEERHHGPIRLTEDPAVDPDHATRRPHLQYSVARFQCTWMMSSCCVKRDTDDGEANGNNKNGGCCGTTINSQSINNDSRLAVQTILSLWESVAILESPSDRRRRLLAPLARLLGLLATAGLAPRVLRRMLSLAATPLLTPVARLSIVRALKTAAAGASRSSLLPKSAPRNFFCFGGTSTGMQRTISGLAAWPFRNDFGMALWFRAERFDDASSPVLLSVRTEDGGGIEVSIVPIEKGKSSPSSTEACTVAISIYDSSRNGKRGLPMHHLLVRGGCVLLPRVWYHLAVRHTRSRLKGVFSLSTRQQVSVMLDGKIMLTESLPFPKISDADFAEESAGTTLLKSTLRRNSSHSSMNVTMTFGSNFEGQTGALHIFNDNVSDASFRALYEMTGGSGGLLKRTHSLGDTWDARRSEIVRKSRVLDVHMASVDADDIVLSQRRQSGIRKKMLAGKIEPVVDLGGEGEDNDDADLPPDLRKAAFGSKVFVTWDPRRTSGSLALELHIGAHINMDGVYSWGISGAQDVISSTGGIQALVPLFRSFLNGDIERSWAVVAEESGDVVDKAGSRDAAFTVIPDLFRLLSSFVQDRNDNARELLRCGGVDVIEQLLHNCKKIAVGKGCSASIFGVLNSHVGLAFLLVETLLEFRAACSHYVGLETKMFSRILFNIPLWLSGFDGVPGAAMHIVLLPVLSTLARINPEKVRDCVGVKDMVNVLKEYSIISTKTSVNVEDVARFNEEPVAGYSDSALTHVQTRLATNVVLGMIFSVIATGTSPQDLSPFIRLISSNFDLDVCNLTDKEEKASTSSFDNITDRHRLTESACTVLLLLFQIRPAVPGLFESFAHTCGGVQGGVGWILCAMVNSQDDKIRSLGIRCLAAYLDVASRGADLPLSLGSSLLPSGSSTDITTDVSSTVRRASTRFSRIAKGLAAMGPNARAIVLPPSKLTARVVFKVRFQVRQSCFLHLTLTRQRSLFAATLAPVKESARYPWKSNPCCPSQLDY